MIINKIVASSWYLSSFSSNIYSNSIQILCLLCNHIHNSSPMETTDSHIKPPTVFKKHCHINLPSTDSSSCRLFPLIFQTKASQKQLLLYFQKHHKPMHTITGIQANIKSVPSNVYWAGTRLCVHLNIC